MQQYVVRSVSFIVLFWLGWNASVLFEVAPHVSVFYIPPGLSVAFVAIFGWRYIPVLFIAAVSSSSPNILAGDIPPFSGLHSLAHALVYGLAGVVLSKTLPSGPRLYTLNSTLTLSGVALMSSFASGLAALFIFRIFDLVPKEALGGVFLSFWAGDFAGVMLVASVALLIWHEIATNSVASLFTFRRNHWLSPDHLLLQFLCIIISIASAVGPSIAGIDAKIGFLSLFPVIVVGLRYGVPGALVAAITTALTHVIVDVGFGAHSSGALELQASLGFAVAMALISGGAHDDRDAAIEDLQVVQERLVRTSNRTNTIVDTLPDVILTYDNKGRCIEVITNESNLLYARRLEQEGQSLHYILPRDVADIILNGIKQVCAEQKMMSVEYSLKVPAGERTFEARISPMHDVTKSDTQVLLVARDITELRTNMKQLRQSQKMEAIGQLTGGVAHDFNNLLAVVMGNAELLDDKIGADLPVKKSLDAILRAVKRGASLTSRLLTFSRSQPLVSASVALNELLLGMDEMFRRTFSESITTKFDLAPSNWSANIDAHQFENAILNLAINASHAMPDGGNLTISTINVSLDMVPSSHHQDLLSGEYIKVTVTDTGTGISSDVLDKVFEPFYTTKGVGEGSGLGLSMVYGFINQSSGHIEIESEVGQGTKIHLYFPRGAEAVEAVPPSVFDKVKGGSESILVVEDDPDLLLIVSELLQGEGYILTEVKNGQEAFDQLKSGLEFDLLFTDVVLPGGTSGLEIANEAKRLKPNIKILYTSGYAESSVTLEEQLKAGIGLIPKPYGRSSLLKKIRDTLDARDA